MWSGQIAFGLVNVPVKLYSATETHDVAFHQVHGADGGRIKYERRCDVCGEVVAFSDIVKAYDDGERTVVITDEELKSLPAEAKDEIEVVQFVPGEEIDPIMLSTPYYLEPVGKSPKAYVLLRRTLQDSELTAVVRYTLRSKTRLGVLRARGDVLVVQTLLWPEDVRAADFPAVQSDVTVSDKELQMAQALVQQFAGDFHPEEFRDDYKAQLEQLIEAKLNSDEAVDTEATFGERSEEQPGGKVVSLLDALEHSLSKRGKAGQEATDTAGDAEAETADQPAKKAAKKAPAKKSAPKRKSA